MPLPKLYLIDSSGLCYRAYYALSGLTTSYGQPTGAVFGFINILNKILKDDKPDYVVCCFDISRDTFRKERYKDYKINRPKTPDELSSQIGLIKEVVSAYNIRICELEGYEADDLIATFAKRAKEKDLDVVVVSSDKDILQLVDEKVKVFDPKKNKDGLLYDEEQVKLKYGLKPNQMIDFFALTGDAADNIPGVLGVGEKTAQELIKEFGNIDNLIQNASNIKSVRLREIISSNLDNIRLSYSLLKLSDDLNVDFDLENLRFKKPAYDKLFGLFKKLEFNSLLKNLPSPEAKDTDSKVKFEHLENDTKKSAVLSEVSVKKELFFILDKEEKIYFSSGGSIYSLDINDNQLHSLLKDPDIKKISHNIKETKISLFRKAVDIKGFYFDTMLAAYLVDSAIPEYSLSELAFRFLEQKVPEHLSAEESLNIILKLTSFLKQKIEDNRQEELFYNLEMPLALVLASMELNGVKVDNDSLRFLSKELEGRLVKLIDEIYGLNNDEEFNINSPKQLANVLFEKLKLPVVKKTKTGISTDEEVLEKLSKDHKLPRLILEYRQLTKLKNTYVDTLPALIDSRTKRIHATFDQVGTQTGRLSSNNPNLQNIPIRGPIAEIIRKSFIAEKGNLLISADYSQIELRVLAHFSEDENLISAFNKDLDVHRYTAALIFQVEENLVSDEMREIAKRINFGIIYGMGSFSLAKDLNIPQEEAKVFIDSYFLRYPKVKKFIDDQIKLTKESGYAKTILGRIRHLPGINSKNNSLRAFAERQAVNSPIQGSAADIIKLAMIAIDKIIEENKLSAKMIMQIHDELVFEVCEADLEKLIHSIRDRMENVYKLIAPLKVNIKKGENWQEMEEAL